MKRPKRVCVCVCVCEMTGQIDLAMPKVGEHSPASALTPSQVIGFNNATLMPTSISLSLTHWRPCHTLRNPVSASSRFRTLQV